MNAVGHSKRKGAWAGPGPGLGPGPSAMDAADDNGRILESWLKADRSEGNSCIFGTAFKEFCDPLSDFRYNGNNWDQC